MKKLFVSFNGQTVVLYGKVIDMEPHSHHFIQICIATGKGFKLSVENKRYYAHAMIITHDVIHQFIGIDEKQIIILIEPSSLIGLLIKDQYLGQLSHVKIENEMAEIQLTRDLNIILEQALNRLMINLKLYKHEPIDARVKKVKEMIKSLREPISLQQLTKSVFLSESRLTHLFKEYIGISIKRYILWEKLMKSLKAVMEGETFTDAAYIGGFSDSAHLARTFKGSFGVTLSDVFKNSSSVQVMSLK